MNDFIEIFTTNLPAIFIFGLFMTLMGLLVNYISSNFFNPFISKLSDYAKKRSLHNYDNIYLHTIEDICYKDVVVRDPTYFCPPINTQKIFINPTISDESGQCFESSIDLILNQKKNIIFIVGEAGSGKTSYLRNIQLQISKKSQLANEVSERVLPYFFSVRKIQKLGLVNLMPLLEKSSSEITGEQIPQKYFSNSLEAGRIVVLLDGLDEIDDNAKERYINAVKGWGEKYSRCSFVMTSRPSRMVSSNSSEDISTLRIEPFSNQKIKDFIAKWTYEVFDDFSDIIDQSHLSLKSSLDTKVKELEQVIFGREELTEFARNPLLLTLMCSTHHFTGRIPTNRASLYQIAVNILLQKVNIEIPNHNLLLLVGQVAFEYQKNGITSASKEFIRNAIDAGIKSFELNVETNEVLEAIITQSGLFNERSSDQISFIHHTFQEYFAARFIYDSGLDEQFLLKILEKRRDKPELVIHIKTEIKTETNKLRKKELFISAAQSALELPSKSTAGEK